MVLRNFCDRYCNLFRQLNLLLSVDANAFNITIGITFRLLLRTFRCLNLAHFGSFSYKVLFFVIKLLSYLPEKSAWKGMVFLSFMLNLVLPSIYVVAFKMLHFDVKLTMSIVP